VAVSVSHEERKITEQVSKERMWGDLLEFVKFERLSGTEDDHKASAFIVQRLQDHGVPVTVYEHPAYVSFPIHSALQVTTPETRTFKTLTHSFSPTTPAGGITGELVLVGTGLPQEYEGVDVRGKIALVDQLATPERAIVAEMRGAIGAVFVSQEHVLHNMIMTTIWGTPSRDQLERLPHMPGVSVVKADGTYLQRLLGQGPVTVRLEAETWTGWKTLKLPVVDIPGPDGTFLLVAGHYDSLHYGATDNGTGDMCLLELARLFWDNRHLLRRGVRVAWWSGHSHGRYAGSTWYADNFWEELDARCVGLLNVDNPGCRAGTMYFPTALHDLDGLVKETVKAVVNQDAPVVLPSKFADESFWGLGFPSFALYVELPPNHPDRGEVGGSAQGWWWHSTEDLLEYCDKDLLGLDTQVHVDAIHRYCSAAVLPYDLEHTAHKVLEKLDQLAGKAGGRFDLSRARDWAERYGRAARLVREAAMSAGLDPMKANEGMMKATRAVNPAIYTRAGRFAHDYTVPTPLLPGLEDLDRLPGLARGSDEERFTLTKLTRERNRLVDGLKRGALALERVVGG
jgi:hypothetical protein